MVPTLAKSGDKWLLRFFFMNTENVLLEFTLNRQGKRVSALWVAYFAKFEVHCAKSTLNLLFYLLYIWRKVVNPP